MDTKAFIAKQTQNLLGLLDQILSIPARLVTIFVALLGGLQKLVDRPAIFIGLTVLTVFAFDLCTSGSLGTVAFAINSLQSFFAVVASNYQTSIVGAVIILALAALVRGTRSA